MILQDVLRICTTFMIVKELSNDCFDNFTIYCEVFKEF